MFSHWAFTHAGGTVILVVSGESEMRLYYLEDTHDWQFDGSRRAVLDVGLALGFSEAAEPVV